MIQYVAWDVEMAKKDAEQRMFSVRNPKKGENEDD